MPDLPGGSGPSSGTTSSPVEAAPPRKRGRPSRQAVINGRRAANLKATPATIAGTTGTVPSNSPESVSNETSLLQRAYSDAYAYQAIVDEPDPLFAPTSSPFLSPKVTPRGAEWVLKATVPLSKAYVWFEYERNDFNVIGSVLIGRAVRADFTGQPNNRDMHDVRARHLILHWNDAEVTPEAKAAAIKKRLPVFRATFVCQGKHNPQPPPTQAARYHRCRGKDNPVKVSVQVNAHDLSVAEISQIYTHPDCDISDINHGLQFSRRGRNLVLEGLLSHGSRPSRALVNLQTMVRKRIVDIPDFRMLKRHQVAALLPPHRRKQRLHENPLAGMNVLAERNPDKTFFHRPWEPGVPDEESDFSLAFATLYTIIDLLLYGDKFGGAIDSTWRNMNSNHAPVTIVCTTNEKGQFRPIAVLISSNVRFATLHKFLEELKKFVVKICKDIVSGKITDKAAQTPEVIAAAKRTIAKGVSVSHWMTDKCVPQHEAIVQSFPLSYVRLCQFHIMQALARWEADGAGREARPGFSPALKAKIAVLMRSAQRCRKLADWPKYEKAFFDGLKKAIYEQRFEEVVYPEDQPRDGQAKSKSRGNGEERKKKQWDWLYNYFKKFWFCDRWLKPLTDMSLPTAWTRDGPNSSTNNILESAIRNFVRSFLDCRENKRIDRLGEIILDDFFDWYRLNPGAEQRMPKKWKETCLAGHRLWEMGFVVPQAQDGVYNVQELSGDITQVTLFPEPSCPCNDWDQTGKICVHMKAAQIYKTIGSVEEQKEREAQLMDLPCRKKFPGQSSTRGPGDEAVEKEVESLLKATEEGVMPVGAAALVEDDPVPDSDEEEQEVEEEQEEETEDFTEDLDLAAGEIEDAQSFVSAAPGPGRPPYPEPVNPWRQNFSKSSPRTKKGKEKEVIPSSQTRLPSTSVTLSSSTPGASSSTPRALLTPVVTIPPKTPAKRGSASSRLPKAVFDHLNTGTPSKAAPASGRPRFNCNLRIAPRVFAPVPPPAAVAGSSGGRDLSTWHQPSYNLLPEEMDVFVACLNACKDVTGSPVLFLMSEACKVEADKIRKLPWGAETADIWTNAAVDSSLKQPFKEHTTDPYSYIAFLGQHTDSSEWSLILHDLRADRSELKTVNLPSTSTPSIDHQLCISSFFRSDRPTRAPVATELRGLRLTELTTRRIESSTFAGFVVVVVAFLKAINMNTPVNSLPMLAAKQDNILQALTAVYEKFLSGEEGVDIDDVVDQLREFFLDRPKVREGTVDRPHSIACTTPVHADSRRAKQSVSACCDAIKAGCESQQAFMISMGKVALSSLDVTTAGNGGQVSPAFMDAFLAALPSDAGASWRVLVIEAVRTQEFMKAHVQSKPHEQVVVNRSTPWFTEDIFKDVDMVIVPLFYGTGKRPEAWKAVAIDMTQSCIHVLDPLDEASYARKVNSLGTRMVGIVGEEYVLRGKGSTLPAAWKASKSPIMRNATANPNDTGILVATFILDLLWGQYPSRRDGSNAGTDSDERSRLSLRREQMIVTVGRRLDPQFRKNFPDIPEDFMLAASTSNDQAEDDDMEPEIPEPRHKPRPSDRRMIGSWMLVKSGSMYYPARVLDVDDDVRMEWASCLPSDGKAPAPKTSFSIPYEDWRELESEESRDPNLVSPIAWPIALQYDASAHGYTNENAQAAMELAFKDFKRHLVGEETDTSTVITGVQDRWNNIEKSKGRLSRGALIDMAQEEWILRCLLPADKGLVDKYTLAHYLETNLQSHLDVSPRINIIKTLLGVVVLQTELAAHHPSFSLYDTLQHVTCPHSSATDPCLSRPRTEEEDIWDCMVSAVNRHPNFDWRNDEFNKTHRIISPDYHPHPLRPSEAHKTHGSTALPASVAPGGRKRKLSPVPEDPQEEDHTAAKRSREDGPDVPQLGRRFRLTPPSQECDNDELDMYLSKCSSFRSSKSLLVHRTFGTLSEADVGSLLHNEKLNDLVVNAWVLFLRAAAEDGVYVANSYFYRQLVTTGSMSDSVRRNWIHLHSARRHLQVDVFGLDRLLVPLFLERGDASHWAVASISFKRKQITYYDSIFDPLVAQIVLKRLLDFLLDHSEDLKQLGLWPNARPSFDKSVWRLVPAEDCPQQTGHIDCGMYAAAFLSALAGGDTPRRGQGYDLGPPEVVRLRREMARTLGRLGVWDTAHDEVSKATPTLTEGLKKPWTLAPVKALPQETTQDIRNLAPAPTVGLQGDEDETDRLMDVDIEQLDSPPPLPEPQRAARSRVPSGKSQRLRGADGAWNPNLV